MTTIELPNEVAEELFLAAKSNNQTVNDYIIFLMRGVFHPENFLQQGVIHPEPQTTKQKAGNDA